MTKFVYFAGENHTGHAPVDLQSLKIQSAMLETPNEWRFFWMEEWRELAPYS